MTPTLNLRARIIRHAAAAAVLAAAMLTVRAVSADTGSVRFIPADCNLVMHVDPEKIVADPLFGPLVDQASAAISREAGAPFNFRNYSSLSVGLSIPPGFSILALSPGQLPEGFGLYVALTAKQPMADFEQALLTSGFSRRDSNGRALLVDPQGDYAVSFSNDKLTALIGNTPAAIETCVAAFSGANATSIPGCGSGANGQTALYVFGTGLERLFAQVAPLIGIGLAQTATSQEAKDLVIRLQNDFLSVGKITAIEVVLGIGPETIEQTFRLAASSPADAAAVARVWMGMFEFSKLTNPMMANAPRPSIQTEGQTAVMRTSENKAATIAQAQQLIAAQGGY